MEDRLLVLRCKRGGAEAMARIYRKYRKDLLVLAMALLNDKAATEDIVQDVFVGFAQSIPAFRLTGSLRAYLMATDTTPGTVIDVEPEVSFLQRVRQFFSRDSSHTSGFGERTSSLDDQ